MVSKEMTFAWCKSGQHDKCRTQYGGDRIICNCDCADHGVNYEPIHKRMTEEEVKASIESINMIMTGDAGDGMSVGNRAVMGSSSIWGDQVKEGNKAGGSLSNSYANTGSSKDYTRNYYAEVQDAATVEELEARRSKPIVIGGGSGTQYVYGEYVGFDNAL